MCNPIYTDDFRAIIYAFFMIEKGKKQVQYSTLSKVLDFAEKKHFLLFIKKGLDLTEKRLIHIVKKQKNTRLF